jgi:hypothetical protein
MDSTMFRNEFNIQEFLHSYPSTLNSKRKKIIKESFIRYIKVLYEQQKLQDQALLLPSNQTCDINQLNYTHLDQKLIIFESIDVIFS